MANNEDQAPSRSSKPEPFALSYAPVETSAAHRGLIVISTACWVLFIVLLVPLCVTDPGFPPELIPLWIALPVVGLACGIVAFAGVSRERQSIRFHATRAIMINAAEILLIGLVFLMLMNAGRPRETAQRVKCQSNLRQIGQSLTLYADANNGQFPATLDLLVADIGNYQAFICPNTEHTPPKGTTDAEKAHRFRTTPGHCSYVFVTPGATQASITADHIIAYESVQNHKGGGMNILFGDGHAEFVANPYADHVRSELEAGHNPPRRRAATTNP